MTDDPFEASLKKMMNTAPDDSQTVKADPLRQVLKTANRQVGAGLLIGLIGHTLEAVMIALSCGSAHIKPKRRSSTNNPDTLDQK